MTNWKKNIGVVPDGITSATSLWVKYRDGEVIHWSETFDISIVGFPDLWEFEGNNADIIEYLLETPEEEHDNQSR